MGLCLNKSPYQNFDPVINFLLSWVRLSCRVSLLILSILRINYIIFTIMCKIYANVILIPWPEIKQRHFWLNNQMERSIWHTSGMRMIALQMTRIYQFPCWMENQMIHFNFEIFNNLHTFIFNQHIFCFWKIKLCQFWPPGWSFLYSSHQYT